MRSAARVEPDERRLLEAARAGDREACADLIRRHYRGVYAFLARAAGDAHLAEDLTQETFAAAWTAIGGFEGRSAVSTWLYRIAYAKLVDAKRRERRDEAAMARVAPATDERPRAYAAAVEGERAAAVEAALGRLGPDDRSVIALHYFQGLSLGDMAEVLGEPVGTVKWRTSRALAALKVLLDGKV